MAAAVRLDSAAGSSNPPSERAPKTPRPKTAAAATRTSETASTARARRATKAPQRFMTVAPARRCRRFRKVNARNSEGCSPELSTFMVRWRVGHSRHDEGSPELAGRRADDQRSQHRARPAASGSGRRRTTRSSRSPASLLRGGSEVSLRAVAGEMGLTPPALYRYVDGAAALDGAGHAPDLRGRRGGHGPGSRRAPRRRPGGPDRRRGDRVPHLGAGQPRGVPDGLRLAARAR